jgi:hypothetical protein
MLLRIVLGLNSEGNEILQPTITFHGDIECPVFCLSHYELDRFGYPISWRLSLLQSFTIQVIQMNYWFVSITCITVPFR